MSNRTPTAIRMTRPTVSAVLEPRQIQSLDKHVPTRLSVPGTANGRIGRVTLYQRNGNMLLRWREGGKDRYDTVYACEHRNMLTEALLRAQEIGRRLPPRGAKRGSMGRATIREACENFLASKEAAAGCSAATLKKYRQEIARIIEFAETTDEGRRAVLLDDIDTKWCREFCTWLDGTMVTPNGGPATELNSLRSMSEKQKQGIRRRFVSVIEAALAHQPRLVSPGFGNPMTRDLVGPAVRPRRGPEAPPVSIDELVTIVGVLDSYALGLLAPLFLYGPRPSELGHVLIEDVDAADGIVRVVCRPDSGYLTKGRIDKMFPLTRVLAACLAPLIERGSGVLFAKRWAFERRGNPIIAAPTSDGLAKEFEARKVALAECLGRTITKDEIAKTSVRLWRDAGAVRERDVRRELRRAARVAKLERIPNPIDCRHLFESQCEEARLAHGVIRHLLGHAPQRGDATYNYNHTTIAVLHEQVALLDERRQPLITALLKRAGELGRPHPE